MADLFENPMGLAGFNGRPHAPERGILEPVFESIGMTRIARHRTKDVDLWRQGGINMLVNYEPNCHAAYYGAEHGPSACAMGFRVKDATAAFELAVSKGAEPVEVPSGFGELRLPAIKGIGGAIVYLIDRYEEGLSIYDIDFNYLEGVDRNPEGCGFNIIDHLTHNVYKGRMDYWASYYERLFNFREIRFFDIKGEYTGLISRAMSEPDGLIRIPLNEESPKGRSKSTSGSTKAKGSSTLPSPAMTSSAAGIASKRPVSPSCPSREVTTTCSTSVFRVMASLPTTYENGGFSSTAAQRAVTPVFCCKSSRGKPSVPSSSSSSSAKRMKALVKATLKHSSNPSSGTK